MAAVPATPVQVLQDPEQAEILLHPVRLKLLAALTEPASASSVAPKIGLPRQHTNYHLRELEKAGLARLVEERHRGSATERILAASARSYVIGRRALGDLGADPDKVRDRFSLEYMVAIAERLIDELSMFSARLAASDERVPSLSIEAKLQFRNLEDRAAFARELANTIAKLLAQYHHAAGPEKESYRVLLAAHPIPHP